MIPDFLKHHGLAYPSHLEKWVEYEHARILRFKGDINSETIPKILAFRDKMEKGGLPKKNTIIDGKKVTDVDSATVAVLLAEMQNVDEKVGLINLPEELKSYLDVFHQRDKIPVFASEEEALQAFSKEEGGKYLPQMAKTLKKNKALSLLMALIFFLIALPFFESNSTAIIYLAFFAFVLLAGIYAVSYNMRHVAGGVLIATPTLITAWSNMFLKNQQILNAEMVFLTIFLIYTMFVILIHVLSVKKVTLNELFAAICVYIMVGMTFGVIYALLFSFDPRALSFPPEEGGAPKLTAFFYFSFVSMSSTGFSGFTATSSLARAIVIVQVIIGVMYISALIGKLVSANTPDDDGLFDNMEPQKLKADFWSQELAENFFRQRVPLLILSMAMLNFAGSVLMTVLHWPFFMDSWGTSLAVILGGLRAGICAGVIYNLIMAFTFWEPSSWVWMFCNILIAVLTWYFLKHGWIDLHKPARLLGAGIMCGLLNSIAVMLTTTLTGLPIYQGTMAVYHFFADMTGNTLFASVAEKVFVEIADKTIALLLAAVAVIFIRDFFHWNKKSAAATS
jgi:ABC-type transporter Mla MlaB component